MPGALVLVLQLFDSSNVVPLRVMAQRVTIRGRTKEVLEIEIKVPAADLPPEIFRIIAGKINQLPTCTDGVTGR